MTTAHPASSESDPTSWTGSGLLAYFLIAFGFTWILHVAIPVLGIPFSMDLSSPAIVLYMLGLLGPLVGALGLSACVSGKKGVLKLFASGLQWRFPVTWYLLALFTVPILVSLDLALNLGDAPEDFAWLTVEPLLVVGQVWVVVGEEYGWRGFALPRMQRRMGSLGAALALGALWAAWHLPMFMTEGSPQYATDVMPAFLMYLYVVVCWSIILAVLYNRTGGSVLACMLFHASLNIAAFSIHVPAGPRYLPILFLPVALLSIPLLPRPLFGRKSTE